MGLCYRAIVFVRALLMKVASSPSLSSFLPTLSFLPSVPLTPLPLLQSCHQCQLPMRQGEPAVYAERAGYDMLWHPACFVCCTCSELLVDMIYFWKKGQLYCGRHYGDSEKPRCGGCDEVRDLRGRQGGER